MDGFFREYMSTKRGLAISTNRPEPSDHLATLLTKLRGSRLVTILITITVSLTHPASSQPREPDYQAMTNSESKYKQVPERLKDEKKNKYRGGVGGFSEVKQNMQKLFEPILQTGGGADKWYSPHLRDILMEQGERQMVIPYRSKAGAASIQWVYFAINAPCVICTNGEGTPETACTLCQPKGSMPGAMGCFPNQQWMDQHITPTCCYKNTSSYRERSTDSNFKSCCVLNAERSEDTEEIACRHPAGDGWAGLFEYYYPTIAIGWENDRTTTMIVEKEKVNQCLSQSRPLMHDGKAVDWVDKAIKKNLEEADKLEGSKGGKTDTSNVKKIIQDVIKDVVPKKEENQFTDSLQGEGLTMRVNFPAMDPEFRRKLAKHFCMRPDQFMKLMDPAQDALQKEGGPSEAALQQLPVWSNYCQEGVQLMTNPDETMKCRNADGTPTDLAKGMQAWKKDPLFCQRMNLANSEMKEYFGGVLDKTKGGSTSEAAAGYTCRAGGKLNGSMVPVELYRHAAVERRTAISDHVLGFLIAGGLYEGRMRSGMQSIYKRFEPRPYSQTLGMFVGKPFYGSGGGPQNEIGASCESVQPQVYQFQNKSDQLFIADSTHPSQQFTGESQIINESSPGEFNRYVGEWAKDRQGKSMPERGLDDKSQNYAAAFRMFATCPANFTRWHPVGAHDAMVAARCGAENLGGMPLQP
jgi:hypothetical protein